MSIDNPTVIATAAIISALSAAGTLIVGLITRQRVRDLHILVNSRLEELVKSSSDLARVQGQAAGHAAGLAEGLDLSRVPVVTPPVVVVLPTQTVPPTEGKG